MAKKTQDSGGDGGTTAVETKDGPRTRRRTLKRVDGTAESLEDAYNQILPEREGLSTPEAEEALGPILERMEAEPKEDPFSVEGFRKEANQLSDTNITALPNDGGEGDAGEDSEDTDDGPERWHAFDDNELALPVQLKVDGEEVFVPLKEALDGYQRQADYTRKTQALAEDRKEVKAVRSQVDELATAYTERLEALGQGLSRVMTPAQKTALLQEYARAKQAQTAVRAHAIQDTLESEHEAAREAFGWSSEDDVQAGYERLANGAVEEYGLGPQDLEGITDHRALVILNDALAYREQQSKLKGAKSEAKKNRRKSTTLKPGARHRKGGEKGNKALKKAQTKLRETGSIHDAAAAIGAILGE